MANNNINALMSEWDELGREFSDLEVSFNNFDKI